MAGRTGSTHGLMAVMIPDTMPTMTSVIMRAIRRATAYGWERSAVAFLEPCQEAFLEEVCGVGVVVGARWVDEHVSDARVAMNVGAAGVAQEGLE